MAKCIICGAQKKSRLKTGKCRSCNSREWINKLNGEKTHKASEAKE